MTSKSSFFKLVRDEARRNIWALALSALGFLFAAPLPLVIYIQDGFSSGKLYGLTREEIVRQLEDRLSLVMMDNVFPRLGLMLMAVLCGIALFRFLHDRRQVDFYHALPIRRGTLYAVKFVTGLLLVLPAYIAARLLTVAIAAGTGLGSEVPWGGILQAAGIDLLAFFLIYGVSILCTVLCGNTICAVVLDGLALFSVGAAVQIREHFAYYFYPTYCYTGSDLWRYCPMMGLLEMSYDLEDFQKVTLAGYVVVAAAALALSFLLFRIRRSERAGKAIAFEPVKLPLKAYVCLVAGIGFGCIVSEILAYGNLMWLLLFTAIGAAVCHCIMETIYDADIRSMLHHLPTLVVIAAVSVALTAGLKADAFGYSKWMPKESGVQWVELYNLYAQENNTGTNIGRYYGFSSDERLTDPTVVRAMLRLTELGVENLDLVYAKNSAYLDLETAAELGGENGSYDISIRYGLSRGRTKSRYYSIPITEESTELIHTVVYSEDYLFWHNGAFRFDEYRKENPDLTPIAEIDDCIRDRGIQTLRDASQVDALLEAMKADAIESTPEQAAAEGPLFTIQFTAREEDARSAVRYSNQATVYPSYRRTLALLEEYADITPQPLSAEEVVSMRIYDYRERVQQNMEEPSATVDTAAGDMFVTNKTGEIASLLEGLVMDNACDRYGLRIVSNVEVLLTLADGSNVRMSYRAEEIPEDLLTEFFGSPLADTNNMPLIQ